MPEKTPTPAAVPEVRVGTAGGSIPKSHAGAFKAQGKHLERYASRLNAVEINSSFYRPHRKATYERWAASVPDEFRLTVKVPRAITHERRLRDAGDLLERFLSEVSGLGDKLEPLLVQLPPSLHGEPGVSDAFLALAASPPTLVTFKGRGLRLRLPRRKSSPRRAG